MRLRNNIFAEAFKWLKKNWEGIKYQKDLAVKIGVSEDTITRIMRDQTEVTDDFLCKFNEAFDNVFNYQWLRGEDPFHMLQSDLIEARMDERHKAKDLSTPVIDQSSQLNATITAYIELVASLKREIQSLNNSIADKDRIIETKDMVIAEQKARLIDYRRIIDSQNGITYQFPIGSAEGLSKNKKL